MKRVEDYKGRKLDLSNHRDRTRYFSAIDSELEKRDTIISNVRNVLNGESTYDETQYKTILDSNRRKINFVARDLNI